tara:strand:- start:1139 stop:1744 length:606 start_codon:yes stop_codon:yes gene_type:complete
MLKRIKVYGRLARFLGFRTFLADVNSAGEAMRFLLANWPELEKHISGQVYKVKVGEYDIGEDELNDPSGCQDIKIIPVATGSGNFFKSTIGKFVIAAAFIAAPYLAPALAGTAIGATTLGAISTSIGISFALSGASQLLFPPPAPPNIASINNPSNQNFAFSGIQQVSRVGTALPLAFGQVFCGSIVVSAGVDTVQVEGQA